MKKFKSLSDKRLIIEAEVNGKKGFFLIDTGASVGLIAEDKVKKFDIVRGRKYPGSLVGAGGEMEDVLLQYACAVWRERYSAVPHYRHIRREKQHRA